MRCFCLQTEEGQPSVTMLYSSFYQTTEFRLSMDSSDTLHPTLRKTIAKITECAMSTVLKQLTGESHPAPAVVWALKSIWDEQSSGVMHRQPRRHNSPSFTETLFKTAFLPQDQQEYPDPLKNKQHFKRCIKNQKHLNVLQCQEFFTCVRMEVPGGPGFLLTLSFL